MDKYFKAEFIEDNETGKINVKTELDNFKMYELVGLLECLKADLALDAILQRQKNKKE